MMIFHLENRKIQMIDTHETRHGFDKSFNIYDDFEDIKLLFCIYLFFIILKRDKFKKLLVSF